MNGVFGGAWENILPRVEEAFSGKSSSIQELEVTAAGSTHYLSIAVAPLHGGKEGEATGAVISFRDDTELRRLREDLAREVERRIPSACGGRIKEKDGIKQLVVVPAKDSGTGTELTISQADFDSLIRSKAAMYTILETIAASVEMSLQELAAFYVGGTFGSFINPESAITIGMLPDLPLASYKPLGNSSLEGASMVLSSRKRLEEIDKIRDKITYLELNVNQEFMNRFSAAKFLPHTNKSLFPSKMPP